MAITSRTPFGSKSIPPVPAKACWEVIADNATLAAVKWALKGRSAAGRVAGSAEIACFRHVKTGGLLGFRAAKETGTQDFGHFNFAA